jgi:Tol biopolymer transport system component
MGEVYKARDTRLDRTVAIKILPETLAADPQFRERFDREARTISQLDHPHICTLYDVGEQDGTSFLVMQYLEGETLEARLKKGALPLNQAIQYAIHIADALATAHKAGIVHRDLKPGNVMLTKSGAKLLDFGLAKTGAPVIGGAGLSMLPTTPPITQQGSILGTFQYMAPEQLEGQEADARTDIFAFGAVVYEMVTGKKAFEGRSQASLIGAIMHAESAPISTLLPLTPPMLDHIVQRALAKDPDERWQTARDVAHELRWGSDTRAAGEREVARPRPSRLAQQMAWPLAIVFAIAAVVIGGVHWFAAKPVQRTVRFEVLPPKGSVFGTAGARMAISPDGTLLAFSASSGAGKPNQIWVRRLDAVNATLLAGTEGVESLFWSPESRFVGFFADQKLKKSDITGGLPQALCSATGTVLSGTWSRDGVILFSSSTTNGIRRVSAEGGEPLQVTAVDEPQARHYWPRFLPDGRHFLFFNPDTAPDKHGIHVGSLDSKDAKRMVRSDSVAEVVPPNGLVFIRDTALFTQTFDRSALEVRGDAVRIEENVTVDRNSGRAGFSVAGNGVLVFAPGSGVSAGADLEFRVFDRTGKEFGRVGGTWAYRGLDLSPDGKHIAAHRHDDRGGDIWITDLENGSHSRLTFEPAQHNTSPIWSPDGTHIAFGSLRHGLWGIYQKASSGVGAEELIFESKSQILPMDWSRDGQTIVFWLRDLRTSGDLWRLPLQGDRKPVPFFADACRRATLPAFSRWTMADLHLH